MSDLLEILGSPIEREFRPDRRVLIPQGNSTQMFLEYRQETKYGPPWVVVLKNGSLFDCFLTPRENRNGMIWARKKPRKGWYNELGYWDSSETEYLCREQCLREGIEL